MARSDPTVEALEDLEVPCHHRHAVDEGCSLCAQRMRTSPSAETLTRLGWCCPDSPAHLLSHARFVRSHALALRDELGDALSDVALISCCTVSSLPDTRMSGSCSRGTPPITHAFQPRVVADTSASVCSGSGDLSMVVDRVDREAPARRGSRPGSGASRLTGTATGTPVAGTAPHR